MDIDEGIKMNDIKRLRRKDVKNYCQKICGYLNRTEKMSATYTYFLRSSGTLEDRNVPIYVDYNVRFTKANAFCTFFTRSTINDAKTGDDIVNHTLPRSTLYTDLDYVSTADLIKNSLFGETDENRPE